MRPAENPFRASRISSLRYRFADDFTWPLLFDRLRHLGNRGALAGPEGSGKTTLLEQMQERLIELGFQAPLLSAKSGSARRTLRAVAGEDEFLLVDSAECFSRLEWLRFQWMTRRAAGLVITVHRAGLLPTLVECKPSSELFEELVRTLLPDECYLGATDLAALFREHKGNVRAAFRDLYDRFSACEAVKEHAPEGVQLLSAV